MSTMPLPLAPFEHFMLADDCPDHPMSFFVQMKLQGRFDRPQLNAALKTALTIHPLLNSWIHGSAKEATSHITWVVPDAPLPTIDWNDAGVPIRFAAGAWIDLRSETGIRLWVRESEAATTLTLQIHHSCCDGLGASSFVQSLLTAYHLHHTSDSTSALEEKFDARLLPDRDLSCSSWRRIFMTARHAFFRISRFIKSKPIPLATLRALPSDDFDGDQFPRFQTFTFNAADTKELRVTAKRTGASLNDLLLRDLFLILDRWNRRHAPDHLGRDLRICVPVNLRGSADRRMPAANMVSMSFLDRKPDQLSDPIDLLANLHLQTDLTNRIRKSLSFVPALKLLGMIPGRLHAHMQRPHCQATAVMSNLGVLCSESHLMGLDQRMVVGGLVLESIEAILPLRPLTHVGFVALTYGGELSLTISHNRRWLDADDGRELLESFVQQLKTSLVPKDVISTEERMTHYSAVADSEIDEALPQTISRHALASG